MLFFDIAIAGLVIFVVGSLITRALDGLIEERDRRRDEERRQWFMDNPNWREERRYPWD